MLIIPLTKDQETIIDDEDADLINYKWHARKVKYGFYASRRLARPNNKYIHLHRIIMERILNRSLEPYEEVDHVDLNKLNNCRENLRLASRNENSFNKLKQSNNNSGYKGVSWEKYSSKWKAQININGKNYNLGRYTNIEDAAEAYRVASEKYHGEFGRTE